MTHESPELRQYHLDLGEGGYQQYRTKRKTHKLSEELSTAIFHSYKVTIQARQQANGRYFLAIDEPEEHVRYHGQLHTRRCGQESLYDQTRGSSPLYVHLNDLIIARL